MRNWWIRFGCFLTGYNYQLLRNCSEASKKQLKKTTSALLIVMILWAFIGFSFASIYMNMGTVGSIISSLVMVVIVVQIERQIILNIKVSNWSKTFRFLIAIIMAVIGSVIIDQIMFKEDIENEKKEYIQDKVDVICQRRAKEYENRIKEIDSLIGNTEKELRQLKIDVAKQPEIRSTSWVSEKVPRKINKKRIVDGEIQEYTIDTLIYERIYNTTKKPNPKFHRIEQGEKLIDKYRKDKENYIEKKITMRADIEKEFMGKTAFMDELKIMVRFLWPFNVATGFWTLWILFFLFIELFVLMCKSGGETDYDTMIKLQMETKIKKFKEIASYNKDEKSEK